MSAHPLSVFQRFNQLTESDQFAVFEEEFAERIRQAIHDGYSTGGKETDIVRMVDLFINSLRNLPDVTGSGFRIVPRSAFIHGFRSMVEFSHGRTAIKRELGDIVFLLSICYRKQVYFERVTFNQAKKAGPSQSWYVEPEQLYLLSSFPRFHGVAGSWVGRYEHNLPNLTGSLGSYGLIYDSDFIFVNAVDLSRHLASRRQLTLHQAMRIDWSIPYAQWLGFLYAPWDGIRTMDFRFASSAAEFSRRFLRFGIGEILFIPPGASDNPQARFLKWDVKRGVKSHWKESNWHKEMADLYDNLSLPYVGQDQPGDDNPLPTSDNPELPGSGIVHILVELE